MTDFSALGHAISVHFAIALFVTSTVSYIVSLLSDKYAIQYQSFLLARWSLWISSAAIIIAVVFGLSAYSSVNHDDMSHVLLNKHRNVALFVGLIAIILVLWSAVLVKNGGEESRGFIFVHILGTAALLYVTWAGTMLVYQNGVGVSNLPNPQTHNHRTYKPITDSMND